MYKQENYHIHRLGTDSNIWVVDEEVNHYRKSDQRY